MRIHSLSRTVVVLFFCIVAITVCCPSSLWAQPSEGSLIQAWEKIQKNDPKTITFEKLDERRYKFKTDYFAFDGELRIKDATVDDVGFGPDNDFALGAVEVELVGLPKNYTQQYSRRYSIWAMNNTLYYDKKAGNWLSSKEFQTTMVKKAEQQWSRHSWGISDYAIIVLTVVGIALVLKISRRSTVATKTALQRQEEAMAQSEAALQLSKQSMQLAEEANKLLKEILEVLKNKK